MPNVLDGSAEEGPLLTPVVTFHKPVSLSYRPIDSRWLEGPFNTDNLALTATPKNEGVAKTVANVPPVL